MIGFSVIPNKIKYDSNISFLSKFILSDIVSFSNTSICFASNGYFAELYNLSESTIKRAIKELKDNKYISIQNVNHNRKITPTNKIMEDYEKIKKSKTGTIKQETAEQNRKRENEPKPKTSIAQSFKALMT